MKRISISTGFVTNSSSIVQHFDKSLLLDPEVASFLETYDLKDGRCSSELWDRSKAASFLVTREQKDLARRQFTGDLNPYAKEEWNTPGPLIDPDKDQEVVVCYGDEYTSFASELCHLLRKAAEKASLDPYNSHEYH